MARLCNSLGTIFALAGAVCSGPAFAEPPPRIAPVQSHPHGQSYGRWAAEWWQWALETPHTSESSNPVLDATGEFCAKGQVGHVWFLAGTFGFGPVERECTIPVGTSLFFPLINAFHGAFLDDPDDERTEEFLRAQVDCDEPTVLEAEIDGIPVSNPYQYFTGDRSPLFNVQLPADNIFGADETVVPELRLSPSAESGYYLFVNPLPAGAHTIEWFASWSCPFGDCTEDVTYHLTVVPGRGKGQGLAGAEPGQVRTSPSPKGGFARLEHGAVAVLEHFPN